MNGWWVNFLAGFIRILRWNYGTDSFAWAGFTLCQRARDPKKDNLGAGGDMTEDECWALTVQQPASQSVSQNEMIMDLCRNWFYYKWKVMFCLLEFSFSKSYNCCRRNNYYLVTSECSTFPSWSVVMCSTWPSPTSGQGEGVIPLGHRNRDWKETVQVEEKIIAEEDIWRKEEGIAQQQWREESSNFSSFSRLEEERQLELPVVVVSGLLMQFIRPGTDAWDDCELDCTSCCWLGRVPQ